MRKLLALTILSAVSLLAQLPTTGLKIQYDMTTVTGGTTLSDLSGNGNNGTLHGTTQTVFGTTFNGSSDYISIPTVVNNSDFTTIMVTTQGNNGAVWWESDAALSAYMRLQTANQSRVNSSGGDSGVFGPTLPTWGADYHAYYLRRSGSLAITGMVDRPYRASATVSGTPNFVDVCGALGAQSFNAGCTGQNSFFSGSIAYVLVYTRALTTLEMNAAYAAVQAAIVSRPVFIPDVVDQISTGPIWTRMGKLFLGQEPSAMYETSGCQLIASPCFKMWYSSTSNIGYAESPDGITWTVSGSTVLSGIVDCSVIHVGSTYYLYGAPGNRSGSALSVYTSSDGIAWTLAAASIVVPGATGTWDSAGVFNPFIMRDGSTWYLFYDGENTTPAGDQVGYATSSDGLAFTKATANPVSGFAIGLGYNCQGPFVKHIGTTWYMWCAVNSLTSGGGEGRYQSSTLNSRFSRSFLPAAIQPTAQEGYAADTAYVELNGKTYMFYSDATSIKLAIANMPISQLVHTSEGAINSVP